MRNLLGYICALNMPDNALALWNEFKVYLTEDFLRLYNEETSFNRALLEIDNILNVLIYHVKYLVYHFPRTRRQ